MTTRTTGRVASAYFLARKHRGFLLIRWRQFLHVFVEGVAACDKVG